MPRSLVSKVLVQITRRTDTKTSLVNECVYRLNPYRDRKKNVLRSHIPLVTKGPVYYFSSYVLPFSHLVYELIYKSLSTLISFLKDLL